MEKQCILKITLCIIKFCDLLKIKYNFIKKKIINVYYK